MNQRFQKKGANNETKGRNEMVDIKRDEFLFLFPLSFSSKDGIRPRNQGSQPI